MLQQEEPNNQLVTQGEWIFFHIIKNKGKFNRKWLRQARPQSKALEKRKAFQNLSLLKRLNIMG
ncbi:MAG: hypothetical protein D3916_03825 [Candidatus Electrothrix sp. MAN1_4]|nr:hypothetical protein [Candidatus Electrothrix sp. MAN1_4]